MNETLIKLVCNVEILKDVFSIKSKSGPTAYGMTGFFFFKKKNIRV